MYYLNNSAPFSNGERGTRKWGYEFGVGVSVGVGEREDWVGGWGFKNKQFLPQTKKILFLGILKKSIKSL